MEPQENRREAEDRAGHPDDRSARDGRLSIADHHGQLLQP